MVLSKELQQVLDTFVPPKGITPSQHNVNALVTIMAQHYGNQWSHARMTEAIWKHADSFVWEHGFDPQTRRNIINEWFRVNADVEPSSENGGKLLAWINTYCGAAIDLPNLDRAKHALASQLEAKRPPSQADLIAQAQARAAKELKQRQQEQLENSEAAFFERVKAAEAKDKAAEHEIAQEVAKQQVTSEIQSMEIYSGPGRIDYARLESWKKAAFGIRAWRVVDGKRVPDWIKTLALVREAKRNTDSNGDSLLRRSGHGVL